MKIYLDDERKAPKGWELVKTVDSLIQYMSNADITHISLDHDLGGCRTGYDFLRWLEIEVFSGRVNKIPEITLHTANPVGRERMQQVLHTINRILEGRKIK
jgi:hypothetical protein